MSNLTLNDCIKFANLTKTTLVQEKLWKESKGKWTIHEGKHKVHQDEYPFKLIYLTTNIGTNDFNRIFNSKLYVHDREKIYLIYSDSNKFFVEKNEDIFREFKRLTKYTPKEYILSFISNEIDIYKNTIQKLDVKYYIDPNIKTPSSFKQKYPNPLGQFINDNDKLMLRKD